MKSVFHFDKSINGSKGSTVTILQQFTLIARLISDSFKYREKLLLCKLIQANLAIECFYRKKRQSLKPDVKNHFH